MERRVEGGGGGRERPKDSYRERGKRYEANLKREEGRGKREEGRGEGKDLSNDKRLADGELTKELVGSLLHVVELVRQALLQMTQKGGGVELVGALVEECVHASQRQLAQLGAVVDLVLEGSEIDGTH